MVESDFTTKKSSSEQLKTFTIVSTTKVEKSYLSGEDLSNLTLMSREPTTLFVVSFEGKSTLSLHH